jgi:hypothetical protein
MMLVKKLNQLSISDGSFCKLALGLHHDLVVEIEAVYHRIELAKAYLPVPKVIVIFEVGVDCLGVAVRNSNIQGDCFFFDVYVRIFSQGQL